MKIFYNFLSRNNFASPRLVNKTIFVQIFSAVSSVLMFISPKVFKPLLFTVRLNFLVEKGKKGFTKSAVFFPDF